MPRILSERIYHLFYVLIETDVLKERTPCMARALSDVLQPHMRRTPYKMETFAYEHDFTGFIRRYVDDNSSRPSGKLLLTVTPREDSSCPCVEYCSVIGADVVEIPYSEQLHAQIKASGALDVAFHPYAEDIEDIIDEETAEYLKLKGLEILDFWDDLFRGDLISSKWVSYTLPPEYYQDALVIRCDLGMVPLNLPAEFAPTQVSERPPQASRHLAREYVILEKGAVPSKDAEEDVFTEYQLW